MSDQRTQARAPYASVGARHDATEIASGATEVLASGTAVVVEPLEGTGIYDS